MTPLKSLLLAIPASLLAQTASANLQVKFTESAPRDRFVIENTGDCQLSNLRLEIDLSDSAGQLIFDTTERGAGVEVFQPFEVTGGSLQLSGATAVNDGDQRVQLVIAELGVGEAASFTIDVDDTLSNSELGNIRVSGSEIKSGRANLITGSHASSDTFNEQGIATLLFPACG